MAGQDLSPGRLIGAEWRGANFFRICELHHTVTALPGTNLHAACIVISMPLEKT